MNHLFIIVLGGFAYATFSFVFDAYLKANKRNELKVNIYKLVMFVILIITVAFAEKYHITSVFIVMLSLIFIEKIKQVKE